MEPVVQGTVIVWTVVLPLVVSVLTVVHPVVDGGLVVLDGEVVVDGGLTVLDDG